MIRLILFSDKEVNCLCPPQCEPGPYAQETLDWQSTARRSYPLCHYVNRMRLFSFSTYQLHRCGYVDIFIIRNTVLSL